MFTRKTSEQSNGLAEQAMQILHPSAPGGLVTQTGLLAQRSLKGLRESSQQLRQQARQASESTVLYIRDEPVKAMLVAAAAGTVLVALVGLLGGSRRRADD